MYYFVDSEGNEDGRENKQTKIPQPRHIHVEEHAKLQEKSGGDSHVKIA